MTYQAGPSLRSGRQAISIVLLLTACARSNHLNVVPDPELPRWDEPRELAVDQQAKHALNRLTYGARPNEFASVLHEGLDKWIVRQLTPENYPDPSGDSALVPFAVLNVPIRTLVDSSPQQDVFVRRRRAELGLAVNATFVMTGEDSARFKMMNDRGNRAVQQYLSAKLTRAVTSEHQLQELIVDFWENHFSVFRGKMPTQFTLLEYDRDVIRPRALGRFRDLLGAVAHSSAMLWYLDNWQSRKNGLNENYGRELMELHTLGVDGGYTQADVIAVARAFTGWSIQQPREGYGFTFNANTHDVNVKTVLGHVLPAGRGVEDGEDVLDILARHPSTARYIATKLVRHFVSDSAPPALVDRAAETFTRTDGDIRQVLAVIVSSQEFYSRSVMRAKVKTPFELVASTYRAMGARPDTLGRSLGLINQLGQPLFGHLTPDGWPDAADAWMNTGSILARINFGANVAAGRVPGIAAMKPVAGSTPDEQRAAVSAAVFQGEMSPDTYRVLIAGFNPLAERAGAPTRVPTFAELVGLALGAPEFQRR